jgi:hypothetical protein
MNITFLVTLKKGAIKTLHLLCKTYGQVSLTAHVFECHKKFPQGTENVEMKDIAVH